MPPLCLEHPTRSFVGLPAAPSDPRFREFWDASVKYGDALLVRCGAIGAEIDCVVPRSVPAPNPIFNT